jgi:hypothetical protein
VVLKQPLQRVECALRAVQEELSELRELVLPADPDQKVVAEPSAQPGERVAGGRLGEAEDPHPHA